MEEERAKILMAEKRYDAAIQDLSGFVEERSEKRRVPEHDRASRYLDLSNFDQAKKYFQRSSRADKKYSSAVNNLGMVYYHQKNFRARDPRIPESGRDRSDARRGPTPTWGLPTTIQTSIRKPRPNFKRRIDIDPTIFERNDRVGTMVQDRSVSNHGLFFFTMAKRVRSESGTPHTAPNTFANPSMKGTRISARPRPILHSRM